MQVTARRRVVLGAALVTAVAGVVAVPSVATADTRTVFSGSDPAGDVRITRLKGLTRAERTSIDLRRVTVQRVDSKARFFVQLKDLNRVRKYDQMLHITWWTSRTASNPMVGDVWMSTKSRYASASLSDPDYTWDEICSAPVALMPRKEQVVVTVPWRCVPEGPVRIAIDSLTGHYRTDAPTWSSDRFVVPGWRSVLPG